MNIIVSLLFVVIVVIVGTKVDGGESNSPITTDKPHIEEKTNEKVLSATKQPEQTIIPETSVPEENNIYETTSDNEYVYPGSTIIETNNGNTTMTSTGNTDEITQWYKNKIISMGMNVNSFVSTKTNGNILNKLSGADRTREVNIEIKKQENSAIVEITFIETIN